MIGRLSDMEIKDAVFSIGDLKAPGDDGYPAIFYKKNWSIVGSNVCRLIKEVFQTGNLQNINKTLVCLIPKLEKPEFMSISPNISM